MGQIVTKDEFTQLRDRFRKEGKTVAHCHGVFDLVHIGHIQHFREARDMADVLVVTVTAAKFVRKGPDRPFFNDQERIELLAALTDVDYVMLSEGYTGEDVIKVVQPNFWVKGEEYEDRKNDTTKVQDQEVALVRSFGGDIRFTHGVRFSSSYLLNKAFLPVSEELSNFLCGIKSHTNLYQLEEICDKIHNLNVLVIGDAIIDEYVYCSTPGNMTKAHGHSTSVLRKERSLGGCLAVAGHAVSFASKVSVLSMTGRETDISSLIHDRLNPQIEDQIIISEGFDTIIKRKYLEENVKRNELHKLFSVNNIKSPAVLPASDMDRLKNRLVETIEQYDLVICCDFGHGLIDAEVLELLQKRAKFLAVNCQTNATNYGMNLITKYNRADMFSLNQKELSLALGDERVSEEDRLQRLRESLHAGQGWLTRGSSGAYGIDGTGIVKCPAVSTTVVDTIGAGDSFFVMAALAGAVQDDVSVSTFLGNIAGALGANIVGNSRSIERSDVLKFAATLLNI